MLKEITKDVLKIALVVLAGAIVLHTYGCGSPTGPELLPYTDVRNRLNRVESRVAAGVCPCCSRTFKQLAAHMKRKHPEYAPDPSPDGGE